MFPIRVGQAWNKDLGVLFGTLLMHGKIVEDISWVLLKCIWLCHAACSMTNLSCLYLGLFPPLERILQHQIIKGLQWLPVHCNVVIYTKHIQVLVCHSSGVCSMRHINVTNLQALLIVPNHDQRIQRRVLHLTRRILICNYAFHFITGSRLILINLCHVTHMWVMRATYSLPLWTVPVY